MRTDTIHITKGARGWHIHAIAEGVLPHPMHTHSGSHSLTWALYSALDHSLAVREITVRGIPLTRDQITAHLQRVPENLRNKVLANLAVA